METKVEKKKSFIINFIYACIFILLYYVAVKYALGFLFPFVFAAALAMFLQKPIAFLKKKLHIKSTGSLSFAFVLFIIVAVISLLFVLGMVIFNELRDFFTFLFSQFSSLGDVFETLEKWAVDLAMRLPSSVRTTAVGYINDFFANIGNDGGEMSFDFSMLSAPLSGAWSVVKSIPGAALGFLVTIISCFFMTVDYDRIKSLIFGFISPSKAANLSSAKSAIMRGTGKLIKAYATIMLITFLEMFLGLYLMKVIGVYGGGYIAIISFVVCVVDIIPVLGTGTVVIPWALYNLFFGELKLGIALIILYAVITVLRQIIEPKLVANEAGLPAIVTIMAMFIGARLFGAFGIIIMPFTVIILKLMYDEGFFGNKKAANEAEDTAKSLEAASDSVGETAEGISAAVSVGADEGSSDSVTEE